MVSALTLVVLLTSPAFSSQKCVEQVIGSIERSAGRVAVRDLHGNTHAVTNRKIDELTKIYKRNELDLSRFKGRRVLDAGCGGGWWVEYLRSNQIDAMGIDIYLGAEMSNKPHFKLADMRATGFPAETFEEVFSTASLFLSGADKHLKVEALRELSRITKRGGRINLGDASSIGEVKELLRDIPTLEIEDSYYGYYGDTVIIRRR